MPLEERRARRRERLRPSFRQFRNRQHRWQARGREEGQQTCLTAIAGVAGVLTARLIRDNLQAHLALARVGKQPPSSAPTSLPVWTRITRLAARCGRLRCPGDPRAGPRDADFTGRATASVGHRTAASRGETNGRTAPPRPCPGTIASTAAASSCRLCLCHARASAGWLLLRPERSPDVGRSGSPIHRTCDPCRAQFAPPPSRSRTTASSEGVASCNCSVRGEPTARRRTKTAARRLTSSLARFGLRIIRAMQAVPPRTARQLGACGIAIALRRHGGRIEVA